MKTTKKLTTGAARFIGNAVWRRFLEKRYTLVGPDNINDYYDPKLKFGRLRELDMPKGNSDWNEENLDPAISPAIYWVYNIGNQRPTRLMDYIRCIETAIKREARKNFLPMQPGDVYQTYAGSSALGEATGFKPGTPLQNIIDRTVAWFREYYRL